jgi:uncharacterized membrane protein YdfJ with MMPL/SSD domain
VTDADRAALTAIGQQGQAAGLQVSTGGTAMQAPAKQSGGELIGLLIAALVLVITFGSLLAAGLPLLNAVFGIAVALCSITVVGSFVSMSSSTSALALMLGLAVAVDYALFIVSRYRAELAAGREPEEAAGRALGTAGSAVLFAGLTVMVALAGLSIIGIALLTDIGLAAAVLLDAFVVRMTLVPAVMTLLGRSAWALPAWLDRVLPDVDVEGESLRRALDPVEPAADASPARPSEDLDEADAHDLEPTPAPRTPPGLSAPLGTVLVECQEAGPPSAHATTGAA